MSTKLKITLIAPCGKALSQTFEASHHTIFVRDGMTIVSLWEKPPLETVSTLVAKGLMDEDELVPLDHKASIQPQGLVTKIYAPHSFSIQVTPDEECEIAKSAE